jgi:hypothetical protein
MAYRYQFYRPESYNRPAQRHQTGVINNVNNLHDSLYDRNNSNYIGQGMTGSQRVDYKERNLSQMMRDAERTKLTTQVEAKNKYDAELHKINEGKSSKYYNKAVDKTRDEELKLWDGGKGRMMTQKERQDSINKNQRQEAYKEFSDKNSWGEKQYRLTQDQIDIERKSLKIETEQLRAIVNDPNENKKSINNRIETLRANGQDEQADILERERDANEQEKKSKKRSERERHLGEVTKAYLTNEVFRDFQAVISSKSGNEAAVKGGNAFASITGAITSVVSGTPMIGQLAKGLIEAAITPISRTMQEREELTSNVYKGRALTGRAMGVDSLSRYGYSMSDLSAQEYDSAKAAGKSFGAEQNAQNTLGLERGFGVDKGTVAGVLEMRQNTDALKVVGGLYSRAQDTFFKGGDRTFLNEFVQKSTQLQGQLLQTSERVNMGIVTDQVTNLSKVSPMYDIRDPRGMQNIMQLNNSLVNPDNDYKEAFSYGVLRRAMPGADLVDIKKEQEKGIGSQIYLKATMENLIAQGGGNRVDTVSMIAQDLTGGNYTKAEALYNNRDAILEGKISGKDLESKLSASDVRQEAEKNTTREQQSVADIKDGFVRGATDGMLVVGAQMVDAVKAALSGAVIQIGSNAVMQTANYNSNAGAKAKAKAAEGTSWMMDKAKEAVVNAKNELFK